MNTSPAENLTSEEEWLSAEEQRLAEVYARSEAQYQAQVAMLNTWKIHDWGNCRIVVRYLSTFSWRVTIQRITDGELLRIHDMTTFAEAIKCLHEYAAEIIRSGEESIDIHIRKGIL